MLAANKAFN